MILVRYAKGRCPPAGSRNPGSASDPSGPERAGWGKPRGCRTDITGHTPRDVSMAGAVPSRRVEWAEGQTPGGAVPGNWRGAGGKAPHHQKPQKTPPKADLICLFDTGEGCG